MLRIERYFAHIQSIIETCPVVQTFSITYDKRSTYEGYIHGEIIFADESCLHLREFVDVEAGVDRLTYVYQYMSVVQALVFRYDNTGHHRKFKLSTYPHHKHDGSEDKVIAAPAPELATVLQEIQTLMTLPA